MTTSAKKPTNDDRPTNQRIKDFCMQQHQQNNQTTTIQGQATP